MATGSVDNILKIVLLHVKNHLFLAFFNKKQTFPSFYSIFHFFLIIFSFSVYF